MVTQQDIEAAEAAVAVAEAKLDQAEAHHATAGSETAVSELQVARAAAHGARDRVRRLKSQWAAQHEAEARRTAAEAGFPERERKAVTKRLEAARDEAVSALVEAERAAARLLAATAAYGALVRETAADLKGRDLSADDGQALGGTTGGAVHLGGETWRPADPGSLLGAIMQGAVAAHAPQHPLGQLRWGQMGGLADKAARDALLGKAAGR